MFVHQNKNALKFQHAFSTALSMSALNHHLDSAVMRKKLGIEKTADAVMNLYRFYGVQVTDTDLDQLAPYSDIAITASVCHRARTLNNWLVSGDTPHASDHLWLLLVREERTDAMDAMFEDDDSDDGKQPNPPEPEHAWQYIPVFTYGREGPSALEYSGDVVERRW